MRSSSWPSHWWSSFKISLSRHQCLGVVKIVPHHWLWQQLNATVSIYGTPPRSAATSQSETATAFIATWRSVKARRTSTYYNRKWWHWNFKLSHAATDAWTTGQIFPIASSRSEFSFILYHRERSRESKRLPQVNNLIGKKNQIQ